MSIYRILGNGGGSQVLSAEELAVLSIQSLSAYVDFNDNSTITLDSSARISTIKNKADGTLFSPGLAPTGTLMRMTTIGSDGQQGLACASNRSAMISSGNIFPASGSFTCMAILQQNTGTDGFFFASGEEQNATSGGPFVGSFNSSNAGRLYSQYYASPVSVTGFTNDGGVCCAIYAYNSGTNTVKCFQDGVLKYTATSFAAPAYTDRRLVINGARQPGSYTGFVEGVSNLCVVVNQFCDAGSNELTALMDLANSRFPTEAWASL